MVDEIFLRTHRGMGTPIVLQGLWRTADPVEPELLGRVHTALRDGPLGRRVVRARVPGARRRWQQSVAAHPLTCGSGPIAADALLDWANGQGTELDPEFGPGWRLAATAVDDGGTVVSLTCSHALADGHGLILAIDAAMTEGDPIATTFAPPGSLGAPAATGRPTAQSDWADARRQWGIVLGGTARALWHGIPRQPATGTARRTTAAVATHDAVLTIPATEWDAVAAGLGGTANSLFLHAVSKMLWDSGFPESTIVASVPVDTRDEPRVDNDLAVTEVAIARTDTPGTLRAKCRVAYERHMTGPGGLPGEILQVVPDRLAHKLSRGAGERDILCSNLGVLPESLARLGPHRCRGLATRAVHPGLRPETLPRTRLSAYLSRLGDTYTLALVSLDPDRIRSRAHLLGLARHTLSDLGLTALGW